MRNIMLGAAAIVAIAACGKSDSGPEHWSKRPTETVSATVGGQGFTIEVPKGMRQEAEADEVRFDFLEGEYVFTPEIVVRLGKELGSPEKDLQYEKDPNVLRKEAMADGWVVSMENSYYKGKEDYIVHAEKKAGDKVFVCNARVTPWKKGETVKDKVGLVEKMCLSIAAK
jgi:hypothetical protein